MSVAPLREDLLALSTETLAALANRGLVKRAVKELDAGAGPEVGGEADGAVTGRAPDGAETRLPVGTGLDGSACSCAATGVCRHRIALVLAYQRLHAAPQDQPPAVADAPPDGREPTQPVWSPGEFDDERLESVLGRSAVAAARRAAERGYAATVHRAGPAEPVPWVELPTCTVRFPVPHELGYALTDAAAPRRGEMIALAVRAFRAADAADAPAESVSAGTAATVQVSVGGRPGAAQGLPARSADVLAEALALADQVLIEGVAHTSPVLSAHLERASAALTRASLHWPAAALGELRGQVDAYAARAAQYEPAEPARLLAELYARRRAGRSDPAGALGTQEPAETQLRRARLVALGCRVTGRGGAGSAAPALRSAAVYFAHPDAGITLVLRRQWELTDGQPPTGHELGARRLLGSPLNLLAAANVVSETLARGPSRTVAIRRGRVAGTSITPLGRAWAELPQPLLVRDVRAQLRAWDGRPPRLVRPRVEADAVRVVAVGEIGPVGYDPGRQRLEALVRDEVGTEVVVRADYDPVRPGSLDALAEALRSGARFVSGMLRLEGGCPVLDPLAVLTERGCTVPDLAPGGSAGEVSWGTARAGDPIASALDAALAALAELAHLGLRGQGHGRDRAAREALTAAAAGLRRTGLRDAASRTEAVATALAADSAEAAAPLWADAAIQLLVALELHEQSGAG